MGKLTRGTSEEQVITADDSVLFWFSTKTIKLLYAAKFERKDVFTIR